MKGITIILHDLVETGRDGFGAPIYDDVPVTVDDVLVAPMTDTEILETFNLTGRKAEYQLGILKGDTHDWSAGKKVSFFGKDWRIIGIPLEGIDDLIPLRWNKKVKVERYE